MKTKIETSQVIDLTIDLSEIPCPMNLVKFKFHFSEFAKVGESFTVTLKGEGFLNVQNFLKYKNANFEILGSDKIKISFT